MVLLSVGAPVILESLCIPPKLFLGVGTLLIAFPPMAYFFWFKPKDEKKQDVPSDREAIQSVIDDTYTLYNETGLLVKNCFLAAQEVSFGNSVDLHKKFDGYNKTIKGRLATVSQALELEVKVFRLFDILFEYKRGAEAIVSATKTDNRNRDQQKLEQKFTNEVVPLYSEIEVVLRRLINKSPNKAMNADT